MRDYSWDLNNIIQKSNELGSGLVEGFSLQLDSFLYNNKNLTEEQKIMTEKTIEFLHGLVNIDGADNLYEKGYNQGYDDAMN